MLVHVYTSFYLPFLKVIVLLSHKFDIHQYTHIESYVAAAS